MRGGRATGSDGLGREEYLVLARHRDVLENLNRPGVAGVRSFWKPPYKPNVGMACPITEQPLTNDAASLIPLGPSP